MANHSKDFRILDLYRKLTEGEFINKKEAAQYYHVNARSIQRDIDDLRAYFAEQRDGVIREIKYDRRKRGYHLVEYCDCNFTNGESLAVLKILLESRSLIKEEMLPILDKLLNNCVPKQDIATVKKLIANEREFYVEPHHGKSVLRIMWTIGEAVINQQKMRITYKKLGENKPVIRVVEPVGILFSEFYFYMPAFHAEDASERKKHSPRHYRIDRILEAELLPQHFHVSYRDRFQEGEYKKYIQFMFGGHIRTVRFEYSGLSLEAVLDRVPTARVVQEQDGIYTIEAEVIGDGIDMWLRSQGDTVKIL